MSQLNPPITDHYAESAAERDKRRAKSVRWLIIAVDRACCSCGWRSRSR